MLKVLVPVDGSIATRSDRHVLRLCGFDGEPHPRVRSAADHEVRLDDIDRQRSDNADATSDLHERQGQARANLGALGTTGDEGSLRQRYIAIMSESEDRLATLQSTDDSLAAEYATVESDINTKLDALSSGTAD